MDELIFILSPNVSPDSFVQLSMQLAYFRLYGKIVSQYEPVLTKAFYHGRTEAMRTATDKAAAFCKIFMDTSATKKEKLEALRVATQHHSVGVKQAASGHGIESEINVNTEYYRYCFLNTNSSYYTC